MKFVVSYGSRFLTREFLLLGTNSLEESTFYMHKLFKDELKFIKKAENFGKARLDFMFEKTLVKHRTGWYLTK